MIGPRVGSKPGVRSGLAVGVSEDAIAPVNPMAGVMRDATSLKYVPSSSAEWTITRAAAGISSGNPTSLWLMQEASGNLADSIASNTLAATSLAGYQQAVSGWTRGAISMVDASSAGASNGSIGDVGTYSALLLLLVAVGPTIGGTRDICGLGGGGTYRGAQVTTTPRFKAKPNDGSASPNGTANPGTTVHPLINRVNLTAGSFSIITDQEIIAQSPYTAPPAPSAALFLGSALTTTPDMKLLYGAYFQAAAAELSDAAIRTLLTRLGWAVAW